jgi:hypothetical protein
LHTWGPDREEVTYEDLINRTGEHKAGYKDPVLRKSSQER